MLVVIFHVTYFFISAIGNKPGFGNLVKLPSEIEGNSIEPSTIDNEEYFIA